MGDEVEIWKPIVGYEEYAEVSNRGRVRTKDRIVVRQDGALCHYKGKMITNKRATNGYLFVTLHYQGKDCMQGVHRLVAKAFIPNPLNKPCVDHINTKRDDNRVENLRWATYVENGNNPLTLERERLVQSNRLPLSQEVRQRMSETRKGTHCGKDNPFFGKTHTEETRALLRQRVLGKTGALCPNSKKVYQTDAQGNLMAVFDSTVEAAKSIGVSSSLISVKCRNHRMCRGYYFSYKPIKEN